MKIRWQQPKRTVVVHLGRRSINMALAESAGEAVRFHDITRFRLAHDEQGTARSVTSESGVLDTELIVDWIRREVERHGWQGLPAACLLSGSATSTQSFLFPPMPDEDLRSAISLKMTETLHFDLEDAYFDHRRAFETSNDDQSPTLTLVAAARIAAIRQGVSALRRAGLQPVAIGAAAESLANLSQCTSLWDSKEASIHVDIGPDSAILNLFEGNQLRFSREIATGGDAFTRALMRPILTMNRPLQLTHDQAEEVQVAAGFPMEDDAVVLPHGIRAADILPLVEPVAQRLSAEIGRSIDYLSSLLGRPSIDKVVLSGSTGTMRNLDRFLQESLNTPVECSDPVARAMNHWRLAVSSDHPQDLVDFCAILGYSLGNRQPINLLPREEKLGHLVEKLSRVRKTVVPLAAAAGVCLALVGVPIGRTYKNAGEAFQRTSEQADSRLQELTTKSNEEARIRSMVLQVNAARGPIPDWVSIMKELSFVMPEQAQITWFESGNSESSQRLSVIAHIHPGEAPFDAVSSRLATSLAESPYFEDVHVIEASIALDESHGRFEATMKIVAGGADSWRTP